MGPLESYEGVTSPTIMVVSFWSDVVSASVMDTAATANNLFSKTFVCDVIVMFCDCMLGKNFSRQHFEFFFLTFPRKNRQFA